VTVFENSENPADILSAGVSCGKVVPKILTLQSGQVGESRVLCISRIFLKEKPNFVTERKVEPASIRAISPERAKLNWHSKPENLTELKRW